MNDDTDEDASLAYYLFVNHGILPHVVVEMGTREKAFVIAMVKRELKNRPKK